MPRSLRLPSLLAAAGLAAAVAVPALGSAALAAAPAPAPPPARPAAAPHDVPTAPPPAGWVPFIPRPGSDLRAAMLAGDEAWQAAGWTARPAGTSGSFTVRGWLLKGNSQENGLPPSADRPGVPHLVELKAFQDETSAAAALAAARTAAAGALVADSPTSITVAGTATTYPAPERRSGPEVRTVALTPDLQLVSASCWSAGTASASQAALASCSQALVAAQSAKWAAQRPAVEVPSPVMDPATVVSRLLTPADAAALPVPAAGGTTRVVDSAAAALTDGGLAQSRSYQTASARPAALPAALLTQVYVVQYPNLLLAQRGLAARRTAAPQPLLVSAPTVFVSQATGYVLGRRSLAAVATAYSGHMVVRVTCGYNRFRAGSYDPDGALRAVKSCAGVAYRAQLARLAG